MQRLISLILPSVGETLYLVAASSFFAALFGTLLGICLVVSRQDGLAPHPYINKLLSSVVDVLRAIPFVILLIFIMPFTKVLVGRTIGVNAAIVPLSIAAIPFFARLVETALLEVPAGMIEAAKAMGFSTYQIIVHVLLNEALPMLVRSLSTTIINIIGYSAMAGIVGGGGLGDLAIRYGYHRFRFDIMLITVVLLVFLVYGVQILGTAIATKLEKS